MRKAREAEEERNTHGLEVIFSVYVSTYTYLSIKVIFGICFTYTLVSIKVQIFVRIDKLHHMHLVRHRSTGYVFFYIFQIVDVGQTSYSPAIVS